MLVSKVIILVRSGTTDKGCFVCHAKLLGSNLCASKKNNQDARSCMSNIPMDRPQ